MKTGAGATSTSCSSSPRRCPRRSANGAGTARAIVRTLLHCASMSDRLSSGERLAVNESLGSPSGQFSLVLQDDGNLVLYDQDHAPVWASGTDGQQVSSATMQADGNLVLSTSAGDPV